jgi:hypothetical protein
MSRFDLSNAGDFAKTVLGDISGILEVFGGRNPSEWDIFEGSYNGILFHIFQSKSTYQGAVSNIEDQGGRRLVEYRFPYRDGQTTDDLGRSPESFNVNILIHGERYLTGLSQLIAQFNRPQPGDLIHPVRGKITAKAKTWQLAHTHESRNAVGLVVTFVEHNFSIGDFRQAKDSSVKGALAKAIDTIRNIQNAIDRVTAAAQFLVSSRSSITQKLQRYKDQYASILGKSNKVFNFGGSSADIPGLIPVNEGGLLNEDGTTIAGVFPVATSIDRLQDIPVADIEESTQAVSVAAADLAKQVNEQRTAVAIIIEEMRALGGGVGSLEFYAEILDLRESANFLQNVLETGVASSQAQVIEYQVPRVMSLREVAFINGIQVDRVDEIAQLNPELFSTNCIEANEVLRIPKS